MPKEAQLKRTATTSHLSSSRSAPSVPKPRRKSTLKAVCIECGRTIHGGSTARALGQDYHLKCYESSFKCCDCGSMLTDSGTRVFREQKGERIFPLCEYDYYRRRDLICASCNKPLTDNYRPIKEKKYHPDTCFYTCRICDKRVNQNDSTTFVIHDDIVYCRYHFSTRIAKKCPGCREAIINIGVQDSKGKLWHDNCLPLHKEWGLFLYQYTQDVQSSLSTKTLFEREVQVMKIAEVISQTTLQYEVSARTCLGNAKRYSDNGLYQDAVAQAGKLRAHLEALCGAEMHDFSKVLAKEHEAERKLRSSNLEGNVPELFKLLYFSHTSPPLNDTNGRLESLVTKINHDLNNLIRTSLHGLLFSVFHKGREEPLERFLALIGRVPIERAVDVPRHPVSLTSDHLLLTPRSISSNLELPRASSPVPSDHSTDLLWFHSGSSKLHGTSIISVEDLCVNISAWQDFESGQILSLQCRKELKGVRHEFLVLHVRVPFREDIYVRLDRAAKRQRSDLKLASVSSAFQPDDIVRISSTEEGVLGPDKSDVLSHVLFSTPPLLSDLSALLTIVCEESTEYTLHKQNCYFFASVIEEMLMKRFAYNMVHSKLQHENLGDDIRRRIRDRWMKL